MTAGYRIDLTVLLQLMTVVDDVKAYRRIEIAFGSVDQCHTPSANCFGGSIARLLGFGDMRAGVGRSYTAFVLSSTGVLAYIQASHILGFLSLSAAFQMDVGEVVDDCACLSLSEPSSPYTSLIFCTLVFRSTHILVEKSGDIRPQIEHE